MRFLHRIIITTPRSVYEYTLDQFGGLVPHKGEVVILTPGAATYKSTNEEVEKAVVTTVVYDTITGVVYINAE